MVSVRGGFTVLYYRKCNKLTCYTALGAYDKKFSNIYVFFSYNLKYSKSTLY